MRFLLTLLIGSILVPQAATPATVESPETTRVLVAYHSQTGNTEALARQIAAAVDSVASVEVTLRKIEDVSDQDIRGADGILVGTPVYWASLHARVKDFLDRVGRVLDPKTLGEGRTAGAFCTGGAPSSGNELARIAILSALLNMRFVVIGGVETDGFGTLGAAATTGPADPGLSEDEFEAARLSGARFARITAELAQARRQ